MRLENSIWAGGAQVYGRFRLFSLKIGKKTLWRLVKAAVPIAHVEVGGAFIEARDLLFPEVDEI